MASTPIDESQCKTLFGTWYRPRYMRANVRPYLGHGIDFDVLASVRPFLGHGIDVLFHVWGYWISCSIPNGSMGDLWFISKWENLWPCGEWYRYLNAKVARGSLPYVGQASHTIPEAFGIASFIILIMACIGTSLFVMVTLFWAKRVACHSYWVILYNVMDSG